jgi:CubicO group peptidase (beta-lactamase class C family)
MAEEKAARHEPVDWFPGGDWPEMSAGDAGFNAAKLDAVGAWYGETASSGYRVLVLRHGHLVATFARDVDREAKRGIGSGQKTLYGCMLAVAVEEKKIGSADDLVVDYFPRMMEATEGFGPRADRFVTPKDREITFRQLITNTSGYLKPAEKPGERFNYQTFGMNLLTHAIEAAYGCYDATGKTSGFGQLVQEKIGAPLGVRFGWSIGNFELPPTARVDVFGNGCNLSARAVDWARIAAMWMHGGRWNDRQVVPEAWLREGTRVSALVKAAAPEEEWAYGHAFWANDYQQRWPGLPKDAFAACGAGYNYVWVCPSLDMIAVQNPGGGALLASTPDAASRKVRTDDQHERERESLQRIVGALA